MIDGFSVRRLGVEELDAQDKAPENDYGNYENSSPADISGAVRFFFIFPDAVCEAVEHKNLLLGRYKDNLLRKSI